MRSLRLSPGQEGTVRHPRSNGSELAWADRTQHPKDPNCLGQPECHFPLQSPKSRLTGSDRCLAQPALASSTRGSPIPGKRPQNKGQDSGPISPPHTELAPDAQGRSPKDGEMLTCPSHTPSCHPEPCTEPPLLLGAAWAGPNPDRQWQRENTSPLGFFRFIIGIS